MTVICGVGHEMHGVPRKVAMPLNNCPICVENAKITPAEFAAQSIRAYGGTLMSPYVNATDPFEISCKNGHIFRMAGFNLREGQWCRQCRDQPPEKKTSTKRRPIASSSTAASEPSTLPEVDPDFGLPVTTKHSLNVYRRIKEKGFWCLSKYKNGKTIMTAKCQRQHTVTGHARKLAMPLNNCLSCWKEDNIPTKEIVRLIVNSYEGKLLTEYEKYETPVEIRCKSGHTFSATYSHLTGGNWCALCGKTGNKYQEPTVTPKTDRIDPHFKLPVVTDYALEVYQALYNKGYQCLSAYNDKRGKMKVVCPAGHEWHGKAIRHMLPLNNCMVCWDTKGLSSAERLNEIVIAQKGTILKGYVDSKTLMKLRCNQGHEFETDSGRLYGGSWCGRCAPNDVVFSEQWLLATITERGGTLLTQYQNNSTHVKIRCENDHVFECVPSSVKGNKWCPFCAGRGPGQCEENFRRIISEKGGTLLSKYDDQATKVWIRCELDHTFRVLPSSITIGKTWCRKCSRRCPEKSRQNFEQQIADQGEKILGTYTRFRDKVKLMCSQGHHYEMSPSHVSHGKGCSKCSNVCPIQAKERFEARVKEWGGSIVGPYANTSTKVDLICARGHKFSMQPNNVGCNKWCRSCGLMESRGERAVRLHLESRNISFRSEVAYPWLPRKRFDFAFEHKNRRYLLEFDGVQHFVHNPHFFYETEAIFDKRRRSDIDKTAAALAQGYYLIRIAHVDEVDISHILDEILNDDDPEFKLILSEPGMYDWLLLALSTEPTPANNEPTV